MIIECINCNKKFNVNSELIPSSGRTIQCGSCNHVWFFNPSLVLSNQIAKTNKLKENDIEIKKTHPIEKKQQINPKIKKTENKALKANKKKNYELTPYKSKSRFTLTKLLSFILVLIISFVALIIVIDTFKSPLYKIFPNLEIVLFSLFEILKDIELFVKDLI